MVIKQLIILSLSVLAGGHQEEAQAGVNKEVCEVSAPAMSALSGPHSRVFQSGYFTLKKDNT